MNIDAFRLEAVLREHFDFAVEMTPEDWTQTTAEILEAIAALPALPSAEPGRDRIAVVVDREGEFGCWKADEDDVSNPGMWEELEENAKRRADVHPPFARAIVRCNLPRPAEPVEVEGSVEYPGIMSGPEPEGTKTWEQDMWGTIKP